ncbi:MAG: hypothetical protein ACP5K8_07220 [Nitrososphaeria archaeon]
MLLWNVVTMFDVVVVHYGELGLKGKNRTFFEKTLQKKSQDCSEFI